jgi:hypothetical protein
MSRGPGCRQHRYASLPLHRQLTLLEFSVIVALQLAKLLVNLLVVKFRVELAEVIIPSSLLSFHCTACSEDRSCRLLVEGVESCCMGKFGSNATQDGRSIPCKSCNLLEFSHPPAARRQKLGVIRDVSIAIDSDESAKAYKLLDEVLVAV